MSQILDIDGSVIEKKSMLHSSMEQALADKNIQALNEKKVLVIYASGAIGAEELLFENHLKVKKGQVYEQLKNISYLCDLEYTQYHQENGCLVTPLSEYNRRTVYKIMELDEIINSRQLCFEDVKKVAEIIRDNYDQYNSFVILCGISTITYFGSILSFLLENLQKTVILTGALVPLSFMRNDGFTNILDSLILAGHFNIPEVLIVMNSKGFRANRCRQMENDSFACIDSPNFPFLVEFGINIEIKWQLVLRRGEQVFSEVDNQLQLANDFATNILIFKINPFLSYDHYKHIIETPGLRCIILECYHFAEMPHSQELFNLIQYAQNTLNILQILILQPMKGQSNKNIDKIRNGMIVQIDITPEAALAKVGYLMGKGFTNEQIREKFQNNLRGEIESAQQFEKFDGKHHHFIQTLSEHLLKKSGDDQVSQSMEFINKYVFPNLGCYMAKTGQLQLLKDLKQYNGDLNIPDFDQRAILHIAASELKLDIIKYLVEDVKVDINPVDYLGYTPMFEALVQKNKPLLFFFKQHGGIIKAPKDILVDLILTAGQTGDLDFIECLYHGGIKNLNDFYNIDYRNVAHMAVFNGQINIIKFLKISAHFDFSERDRWNHTPLDEALRVKNKQYEIINYDYITENIDQIIEILSSIGVD